MHVCRLPDKWRIDAAATRSSANKGVTIPIGWDKSICANQLEPALQEQATAIDNALRKFERTVGAQFPKSIDPEWAEMKASIAEALGDE